MKTFKKILAPLAAVTLSILLISASDMPHESVKEKAPDFTVKGMYSDSLSLNYCKGKLTVVHIWNHMCAHCRHKNESLPYEMSLYKDSIAYVMIDTGSDTSLWKKIIREDHLEFALHGTDWYDPNTSRLHTCASYANKHGLTLIDKHGIIVSKNISAAQLNRYLKNTFTRTHLKSTALPLAIY